MQQNMSIMDQSVRMLVGLLIVALAFVGPQTVWAWLGAIVVFIGAWGFCPLYKVLGISTCSSCEESS